MKPKLNLDAMAHNLAQDIICSRCHRAAECAIVGAVRERLAKRPRRKVDFAEYYRFLATHEAKFMRGLKSIWAGERRQMIANMKRTPKMVITSAPRKSLILYPHTELLGNIRLSSCLSKDTINWKLQHKDGPTFNALFDQWLYPQGPARKALEEAYKKVAQQLLTLAGNREAEKYDLTIDWDVFNPNIDKWLKEYAPKYSGEIEQTSYDELKAKLLEGWEGGESIPDLTKRVNDIFDDWEKWRAERLARTESIRGSNQGALETYEASGVVDRVMWLATPTEKTCEICMGLDGKVVKLNEDFDFETNYGDKTAPPAHPNCVLSGTLCETASNPIAGIRAWYSGEAIKLTFEDGRILSVTPNHLLLTPNGFAAANLLCEGDDIFYCSDSEWVNPINPNDNRKPALIEEIISSLAEAGGVTTSAMPFPPEYLHGDARFCQGNIDIIWADSFLCNATNIKIIENRNALSLNLSDITLSNLFSGSDFASMLKRMAFAADGGMSGVRQSSPFFLRRLPHASKHRGGLVTGTNSAFGEPNPDGTAGNLKIIGQEFLGAPSTVHPTNQSVRGIDPPTSSINSIVSGSTGDSGQNQFFPDFFGADFQFKTDLPSGQSLGIKTIKLVKIDRFVIHDFVYDLQTPETLYLANGLVSSNCRCTVLPILEGEEV